jgi:hypothetical protein
MNTSASELIQPRHLARRAVIYVRQSSPHQVLTNTESQRLQYALTRRARELGWPESAIDVFDADLGRSATTTQTVTGARHLSRAVPQRGQSQIPGTPAGPATGGRGERRLP